MRCGLKVKPGGTLVIDHYKWRIGYYSTLAPMYRKYLRKLKPEKSKKIVDNLVDFFFPIHWKLKNHSALQWLLHRISPLIHFIYIFPDKDYDFHLEICKLDTYDSLTDYYKHLRTPSQIKTKLEQLGAKDIWINEGGNGVEARYKIKMEATTKDKASEEYWSNFWPTIRSLMKFKLG
ncbi:MAG: hypothetical protein IPK10_14470 [Bacteroidetes bacterium]|nr:hypothetical protein [Bacteroidota bacterium]